MKKNLTKLNKHSHWWEKSNTDWATQDKNGDWWIIPGSEFPEKKMKTHPPKRKKQRSVRADLKFLIFVMLASSMGIILATVIIIYLLSL